jgi:hypothetical protein
MPGEKGNRGAASLRKIMVSNISPLPFFKQLGLLREVLKITVMGRMLNAWFK